MISEFTWGVICSGIGWCVYHRYAINKLEGKYEKIIKEYKRTRKKEVNKVLGIYNPDIPK